MTFIVTDTFTDTDETNWEDHVGELGATWVEVDFNDPTELKIVDNAVVNSANGGTGFGALSNSEMLTFPANADMTHTTFHFLIPSAPPINTTLFSVAFMDAALEAQSFSFEIATDGAGVPSVLNGGNPTEDAVVPVGTGFSITYITTVGVSYTAALDGVGFFTSVSAEYPLEVVSVEFRGTIATPTVPYIELLAFAIGDEILVLAPAAPDPEIWTSFVGTKEI